jgi:hypothetical protein
MAAPNPFAVGAVSSGTTTNPTYPAGTAQGHILIGMAATAGNAAITPPAGWAHIPNSPVNLNSTVRLSVIWHRQGNGSDPGDVGSTWTPAALNHVVGRIIGISGCIATGDPWDATPQPVTESVADTSATWNAITTTVIETLILFCIATGRDANTTTNLGALTGGTGLTSIAEQMDNGISTGTGSWLGLVTAEKLAIGSTGTPGATMGTTDGKALLTLALKPALGPPVQTATVAMAQTSSLGVTPLVTHPYAVAMAGTSSLSVTATTFDPTVLQVAGFESAWNTTTTPKSVVVTGCEAGDKLYVIGGGDASSAGNVTAATTSTTVGSTTAWQEIIENFNGGANEDWCTSAWAEVTANGDVTVQMARTGTGMEWGFHGLRVRNPNQLGVSGFSDHSATEVVSLALTGGGSAVLYGSFDWDAMAVGTGWDPAAGVTLVERAAGSNYTVHAAYWTEQAAGTRNYGSTGAAGSGIKAIALEIKKASAGQTATVALAQTSTLAVTPLVTKPATVALAQTSTLAVTPLVTHPAAVAMASSSSLAVTPLVTHPYAVTLAQTSTLGVTADTTGALAIPMVQTSSLAVAGSQAIPAAVALAQSSALSVTGLKVITAGAVALTSVSTLSVTPSVSVRATVAMVSSSTLTVTGLGAIPATVGMAQTSTLAVGALVTRYAAVAMASSSTLAVTGRQTIPATVGMAQTSVLLVTVLGQQTATVALAQTSGLSVIGLKVIQPNVTLAQTSTLAVGLLVARHAAVQFGQTSALQVTGAQLLAAAILLAQASTLDITGVVLPPYGPVFPRVLTATLRGDPYAATMRNRERFEAVLQE